MQGGRDSPTALGSCSVLAARLQRGSTNYGGPPLAARTMNIEGAAMDEGARVSPRAVLLQGDTDLLPIHEGSLIPRCWYPGETPLDAWVISPGGDLRC